MEDSVGDADTRHHFDQWRTHAPDRQRSSTVFVMSAGGINGAAQAGMVRELLDAGVYPDAVVGVSAGAINAVFLAGTPLDKAGEAIVDAWTDVARHGIFHAKNPERLWAIVRHHPSIDSGARVAKIIDDICPVEDLSDCPLPVRIGSLNLDTLQMVWHGSGPARPRILASAAVPGIFPPVMIDGERHVDGGVGSPIPIAAAIEFAPTRLIVLDVSLMDTHPRDATMTGADVPHQSALEVFLASYDAARFRIIEAERSIVTGDTELISIEAGLPGSLLPESSRLVPQLIEQGAQAARRAIEQGRLAPTRQTPEASAV
jgi:NTE family protein